MTQTPAPPPPAKVGQPQIHFDVREWMPYLEHCEVSEEEKHKLIETLWDIVLAFVDLGWRVTPPQNISGQSLELSAVLRAAVLKSEDIVARQKEDV
ncbi:hypothetical protein [uncultured Tateyamaria sp.]|uniref:hypothetical protein n=1 Tax=uncultured Tateyamaria sp. TaxID=455651 RepID=UPI00261709D8|nr:hypothetical protein [uncultured Tateyamaria sp.]